MVNFLLILEKIVKYSKKQIDKGNTPQKVYELCSCIREAFCLSYSIRKENNLYLYIQEDNLLLSFIGEELRYLGPDERSQALLLLKALQKGMLIPPRIEAKMIKSTPGIYYTKFLEERLFYDYFNNEINGNIYLITEYKNTIENELEFHIADEKLAIKGQQNLYIFPSYPNSFQEIEFMKGFTDMKNIYLLSLSKIKSIENKILYINFRKDQQEI